jgi:hypothetical protein
MKRNPKTFISYSHDSEELKRIILAFANQLRQQGINCNLDQYEESPENGWISWMEAEIRSSDYVLVVCTEGYTAKLQPGTKSPQGKGQSSHRNFTNLKEETGNSFPYCCTKTISHVFRDRSDRTPFTTS